MTQGTILVTGGLGYIGAHTVVVLLEAGYKVLILDNLSNSSLQALQRIESITGKKAGFTRTNLQDYAKLKKVFKQNPDIAAVIHFAALKSVSDSVSMPLAYYQNNVGGMLNLLRAMQEAKVQHLIFSSSCTVYGDTKTLPVNEQHGFGQASSPYGNTKIVCEQMLQDFTKTQADFQAISLRYFNPIGAHDSGLLGETSKGTPNNLLPLLLQKALGIRDSFSVFGNNYATHDGTCLRDYIHVEDLAQAHLKALQRTLEKRQDAPCEAFNLGTGKGYSVLDVITTFEKVSGIALSYQIAPRRQGDVEAIYADASLAENKLGWKAQKSLEDMVLGIGSNTTAILKKKINKNE